MADLTLIALLQAVLDAIETYYLSVDVELPERRYIADGATAWDCEQLTVELRRTFPMTGDLRQEASQLMPVEFGRGAEIAVQIVRCAPTVVEVAEGEAAVPTADEIEASALVKLSDAELIPQAFREGYRDGLLPGCGGVTFMGWQSLGPDGGLTGGETVMRLAID